MASIQIMLNRMGFNPLNILIDPPTAQKQDWYVIFETNGQQIGMTLTQFKAVATMVMAFNSELK